MLIARLADDLGLPKALAIAPDLERAASCRTSGAIVDGCRTFEEAGLLVNPVADRSVSARWRYQADSLRRPDAADHDGLAFGVLRPAPRATCPRLGRVEFRQVREEMTRPLVEQLQDFGHGNITGDHILRVGTLQQPWLEPAGMRAAVMSHAPDPQLQHIHPAHINGALLCTCVIVGDHF